MNRMRLTTAGLTAMALSIGMWTAPAAMATPQDSAPSTQAADLPSPQELMDRHIEAIGGAAAIKAIKSRTITGSFEVVGMTEGTMTIHQAAPAMFVLSLDMGEFGSQRQGNNGKVGWALNSMEGASLMSGDKLEESRVDSQFYPELNYAKIYPTTKTEGLIDFEGKPYFRVYQKSAGGFESYAYYDTESGMLKATESDDMGSTTIWVNDVYKEYDGVLISTVNTLHQEGMQIVIRFNEIEHNTVKPSAFDLPAEVKALIKKAPTSQPSTDSDK